MSPNYADGARTQNYEAAGDLRGNAEDFGDDEEILDVEITEDDAQDAREVARADAEDAEDAEDPRNVAQVDVREEERLLPLFSAESTADYHARWDIVQRGFVDDPAKAVRDGDALVSEVVNALARTFADERKALEGTLSQGQGSTETSRLALRRHRAFFERLLSF